MKPITKQTDNGIKIVFVPQKQTMQITMGFFIMTGSRSETTSNNGIAHFLEHLMFKGTKNRTSKQLFKEMDLLGTEYNAVTTNDLTYYYLQGDSENTNNMIDIMLDLYMNSKIREKDVNAERMIIHEERRIRMDDPLMKLIVKSHEKIFKGSSLERTISGTKESVNNIDLGDIKEFKKENYVPHNTFFVFVGNFNISHIMKNIKAPLESINNDKIIDRDAFYKKERVVIEKNIKRQDRPFVYIKKDKRVAQSYMLMVFPLDCDHRKSEIVLELLSDVLTSGFSSRLNQVLRQKRNITYSVSSTVISYIDFGFFMVRTAVDPSKLGDCIEVIISELVKIKKKDITDDELTKIMNIKKNGLIRGMTDQLFVMDHIGHKVSYGEDPSLHNLINKITKVKKADIRSVANKYFDIDKLNIFVYGDVTSDDIGL